MNFVEYVSASPMNQTDPQGLQASFGRNLGSMVPGLPACAAFANRTWFEDWPANTTEEGTLFGVILACLLFLTGDETPAQPAGAKLTDVERCLHALEDPDGATRRQAAKDLAQYKVVTEETVMRIVDICKRHHNEIEMERDAIEALRALGLRAAPAIPFLTSVLLDEEDPPSSHDSSFDAGLALTAMGPAAAPAIPSLMKALRSERLHTRKVAIEALGAIGEDAGIAVPVLLDMAFHDRGGGLIWSIEDKAKRALAKIGAPAIPLLLKELPSESDCRRELVGRPEEPVGNGWCPVGTSENSPAIYRCVTRLRFPKVSPVRDD